MMDEVKECMTLGTTEATITSSTSSGENSENCRNCRIMSPYSSEVWLARVEMR